jgi:hypothetical protein
LEEKNMPYMVFGYRQGTGGPPEGITGATRDDYFLSQGSSYASTLDVSPTGHIYLGRSTSYSGYDRNYVYPYDADGLYISADYVFSPQLPGTAVIRSILSFDYKKVVTLCADGYRWYPYGGFTDPLPAGLAPRDACHDRSNTNIAYIMETDGDVYRYEYDVVNAEPKILSGNGDTRQRISADASGNLYIVNSTDQAIDVYTNTGTFVEQIDTAAWGLSQPIPNDIAVDSSGIVYFIIQGSPQVYKFVNNQVVQIGEAPEGGSIGLELSPDESYLYVLRTNPSTSSTDRQITRIGS